MPRNLSSWFEDLAVIAQACRDQGNYGIAACVVARQQRRELIFYGGNTVFSERDPLGHAEINALRTVHRAAAGTAHDAAHITIRPSYEEAERLIVYTTLEPCPMCTVAIINAHPDKVVIGMQDPTSGSCHPARLTALPPVWSKLAKAIDIVFCQSSRPEDLGTYIPSGLMQRLRSLAFDNRVALDCALTHGILNVDNLLA